MMPRENQRGSSHCPYWGTATDAWHSTVNAFDRLNRGADFGGRMPGLDAYQQRALEMTGSPKARDAFDMTSSCTQDHKFNGGWGSQRKEQ